MRALVWVLGIVSLVLVNVPSIKGLYPTQADLDSAAASFGDNAAARALNPEMLRLPPVRPAAAGFDDHRDALAWLDAEYDEFITRNVNIADSQRFTNAPEFSGALNLEYRTDLGAGSLSARMGYSYQSEVWPTTDLSEAIKQDGYGLLDAGIRCVVAPSFADIFYNNCFKNGILPVVLPKAQVEILMREAAETDRPFTVDLEKQEVTRPTGNEVFTFETDPWRKHCLLNGLDDVGIDRLHGSDATCVLCRNRSEGAHAVHIQCRKCF